MKIYISLPISNRPLDEAREHAHRMHAALVRSGHKVINPFDIYAGKNPTYEEYLCYDLLALSGCDAIMLCDGWQFSRGCRIEANFAKEFGKQILYENQPDRGSEYYFNR